MSRVDIYSAQLDELIRVTVRNMVSKFVDMGVCLHQEGAFREIKNIFEAVNRGKEYSDYGTIDDLETSVKIWGMKIVKNYRWREELWVERGKGLRGI